MKKIVQYVGTLILLAGLFFYCGNYNIAFAKAESQDIKLQNVNVKLEEKVSAGGINLTPKYDKTRGLYGYVDLSSKWVIEPKFSSARSFSEGVAAVADTSQSPKWGYILPDGTYAIVPNFTRAFDFNNDVAIVDDKGFVGTINKRGEYIIKSKYYLYNEGTSEHIAGIITDVSPSNGLEKHKYGIITTKGIFVKPQFDGLPYLKDNFVCFFKEDSSMEYSKRTFFIVTPSGTIISLEGEISKVSEEMGLIEYTSDKELARSNPKRRYAFITAEGKIIKSYIDRSGKEHPFLLAHEFSEGYAALAINTSENGVEFYDVWGFLKKDGTWLIEPTYSNVASFKDGVAPVNTNLSWGYINTDLTWFIKPKDIKLISKPHSAFVDSLAIGLYTQSEHDFCVDKAQSILKVIVKDSMSDYEKLSSVYEYLTKNVKYDENYYEGNIPRVSFSAYGALKYNIAVCEGYSETLGLMLNLMGIENKKISGYVNSDGIGHAWNLVKIGGTYYHVDATWDSGKSQKQYFLKSDEYMLGNRTWDKAYYPKAARNY